MSNIQWLRRFVVAGSAVLSLSVGHLPALAASATNPSLEGQIVVVVNQDRVGAGLRPLTIDPRLTSVAEARAQYMIDKGIFSHCTAGEADENCAQSGYDFVPREQAAGLSLNGLTADENIALNNYGVGSSAGRTNADWLNSPGHKANIMDEAVTYTGVGVACCFVGVINGQQLTAADHVFIYVQDFTGGVGAIPPSIAPTSIAAPASVPAATNAPATGGSCRFVLGFAVVAGMIPGQVGTCADDESHNLTNGDALQHTSTGGLLVWRKADNWTAFTDGFHSWINGPYGLRERLNSQRFSWEANPDGLAIAP